MKTAVVIGSTGLIGQKLVELLANDGSWGQVLAVSRSKFFWKNPKIRTLIADFKNWGDLELQIKSFAGMHGLDFFCCLGTTIQKAKSQEAFKTVDYDYVIEFAKLAQSCQSGQLLIVSALGANLESSSFYLRVKGEMENSVGKLYSNKVFFLRPSLLLGHRSEFRLTERLAVILAPLYSWLLLGPLKKYKPISAKQVALAMTAIAANKIKPKNNIVQNEEISLITL